MLMIVSQWRKFKIIYKERLFVIFFTYNFFILDLIWKIIKSTKNNSMLYRISYLYCCRRNNSSKSRIYLAWKIFHTTKSSQPTCVGYAPVSPLDSNPKLRLTYNQISPKSFEKNYLFSFNSLYFVTNLFFFYK